MMMYDHLAHYIISVCLVVMDDIHTIRFYRQIKKIGAQEINEAAVQSKHYAIFYKLVIMHTIFVKY